VTTLLETAQAAAQAALIPSELTGARPRRTAVSKEDIPASIIAWILIALALAASIWAWNHTAKILHSRAALRVDGRLTYGVVTEIYKSTASYGFSVDDRSFTGDALIPRSNRRTFDRYDRIPILYLPSDPSINHPAAWEDSTGSAYTAFILPCMIAFFVPFILVLSRRERQVVAEGLPAVAVITGFRRGKGGQIVDYEFRTAAGQLVKGSSVDSRPWTVGASLCVLYLERNPRRNLQYPSTHFVVVG
jgi:hypothetical protein